MCERECDREATPSDSILHTAASHLSTLIAHPPEYDRGGWECIFLCTWDGAHRHDHFVCVYEREEVYSRQSCSSESSSQSLSPSHTQERRMHLPLSQWKSSGEQVGSTANERAQALSQPAGTDQQTNKQTVKLWVLYSTATFLFFDGCLDKTSNFNMWNWALESFNGHFSLFIGINHKLINKKKNLHIIQ